MNVLAVVPFRIRYYSIYTQTHGPLLRNDMHVLEVFCKGDTPHDDIAMGNYVHMKEFVPSRMEEYTFHKVHPYSSVLTRVKSSRGHDKSSCNNDCHMQEHYHISCHRQIPF